MKTPITLDTLKNTVHKWNLSAKKMLFWLSHPVMIFESPIPVRQCLNKIKTTLFWRQHPPKACKSLSVFVDVVYILLALSKQIIKRATLDPKKEAEVIFNLFLNCSYGSVSTKEDEVALSPVVERISSL